MKLTHNHIISNKYRFYRNDTSEQIDASNVELDTSGEVKSIVTSSGMVYLSNEFVFTNLVLSVPGLGDALCGDIITLKTKAKIQDFVLGFGWHINISNQKLYTWYLLPLVPDKNQKTPDCEFIKAKTLYYDDFINIVGITKQLPYILPSDIEKIDNSEV